MENEFPLIYFWPMFPIHTPLKAPKKPQGFWCSQGDMKWEYWPEIGLANFSRNGAQVIDDITNYLKDSKHPSRPILVKR